LIINSVNRADIYGYCSRKQLEQSFTKSFGEGPCKHEMLKNLDNIEQLLELFEN